MNTSTGLGHFLTQGDALSCGVALVLLAMSVISWYLMVLKTIEYRRARHAAAQLTQSFWQASKLSEALQRLQQDDKSGFFVNLAHESVAAFESYSHNAPTSIGQGLNANEFLGRAMQQSALNAQARAERGMTVLASIGSTAPFIGLLGTVWGIYHALIGLTGAKQVVLDQVAGPVGEALIMTAAGLFVAIPAVLAYNALARGNRLILAQLDGFAHHLHAYLLTGARLSHPPKEGTSRGV